MVPESLARMSLRPLTTGLSAGSSVALALELFEWADSAHFQPLLAGSSSSSRFIEPWSFILGLLTGLIIYATIKWALTLRWCLVQWVDHQVNHRPAHRPKELYKLL